MPIIRYLEMEGASTYCLCLFRRRMFLFAARFVVGCFFFAGTLTVAAQQITSLTEGGPAVCDSHNPFLLGVLIVVTAICVLLSLALIRSARLRSHYKQALKSSETKYQRLTRNPAAVFFQFKMSADGSYSFPFMSETVKNISGVLAEEVMQDGNVVMSRINPEERKMFEDRIVESARTLQPFHCVFRSMVQERVIWIEARSIPERFPDGSIIWDGFFFDITEQKSVEEALLAKTNELETYFLSALDLLCIADTDGNFIRVSKEWENVLGYDIEYLQHHKYLEFVHPDDLEATHEAMKKLADREVVLNFINRYRGKDGSYRFIEWRSTPKNGLIFAAARDITERKQAIDSLQESEKRAIRQRSAIAEVLADESAAKGDLAGAFRSITRILSETLDVARASIWKLTDNDRTTCLALYDAQSKTRSEGLSFAVDSLPEYFSIIKAEKRFFSEDAQNDLRTGEFCESYLKFHGITAFVNAGIFINGSLYGVLSGEHIGGKRKWFADEEAFLSSLASFTALVVVSDAQKRAEEKLRKSEERLSKILSVVPDMVSVHDRDMNIVYSNWNGFARVPEEKRIIGAKCYKIYRDFDRQCPGCKAERVRNTGRPYEAEALLPDGNWIELRVLPVIDKDGDCELVVEWLRNITERKHAEQLIDSKNKELEQILYVASHDLRSPLVNIDGYSRELGFAVDDLRNAFSAHKDVLDTTVDLLPILSEMNESLSHIRKSARQMDGLLKGLLKLSRLGRAALSFGLLDMNKLLSEVVATIGFETQKNNVDLQVGNLPQCWGDFVQVTQVFVNLLSNAIKYLDSSRPGLITVSGWVEDNHCVYCVEDNGIGIAEAYHDKVFELFHRLDPAKSAGEGLGLTIVKQVLSMIDGDIRLESTPGVGSRFFVSLPAIGRGDVNNRSENRKES